MSSVESVLPREQSLEYGVELLADDLHRQFEVTQQNCGDIFSVDDEMRRNIVDLGKFADFMGTHLTRNEGDERLISDAIYRSICFAGLIADNVLPESYECELMGYINARMAGEFTLDALIGDTQEYLQRRPGLDALLGYYMSEIDRSGLHNDLAEIFAALVFMVSERSIAEQYIRARLQTAVVTDFVLKPVEEDDEKRD